MTNLTPDDFDQLRGAFDDAIAPAPGFAARLKEEIEMEASRVATPVVLSRAQDASRTFQRTESLRGTSWQAILATAAAIAFVLILGFVALREITAPDGSDDDAGLVPPLSTQSSLSGQSPTNPTLPNAITNGASSPSAGDDEGMYVPNSTPASRDTSGVEGEVPGSTVQQPDPLPDGIATPSAGTSTAGFASADASWSITGVAGELGDEIVEVTRETGPDAALTPTLGRYGGVGLYSSQTYSSVTAFDMASGQTLWTFDGEAGSTVISDGTIVTFFGQKVTEGRFGLFALDLQTGEEQWFSEDPSTAGGELLGPGPIIVDGVVYAAFDERIVRAIDAESGALKWETALDHDFGPRQFELGPDSPQSRTFNVQLAAVDDLLYSFTGGQFIDALSLLDGEVTVTGRVLDAPADDASETASFTVDGGIGYFSVTLGRVSPSATPNQIPFSVLTEEGRVVAVDLESLDVLWTTSTDDRTGPVIAVGGPVVAVGTTLFRIDPESGELSMLGNIGGTSSDGEFSTQRTSGDRAWYAMEEDGTLTVVELDATGALRSWSFSVDGIPIVTDIVADPDGSLRVLTGYGPTYGIPAGTTNDATPAGQGDTEAEGEVPG